MQKRQKCLGFGDGRHKWIAAWTSGDDIIIAAPKRMLDDDRLRMFAEYLGAAPTVTTFAKRSKLRLIFHGIAGIFPKIKTALENEGLTLHDVRCFRRMIN